MLNGFLNLNYLAEETSSFEELISSLLVIEEPEDTFSDCLPLFEESLLPDLDVLCSFGISLKLEEFCFLRDDVIFSFFSVFDRGDLTSVLFLDFETGCDQSAIDVANPGIRWSVELAD